MDYEEDFLFSEITWAACLYLSNKNPYFDDLWYFASENHARLWMSKVAKVKNFRIILVVIKGDCSNQR